MKESNQCNQAHAAEEDTRHDRPAEKAHPKHAKPISRPQGPEWPADARIAPTRQDLILASIRAIILAHAGAIDFTGWCREHPKAAAMKARVYRFSKAPSQPRTVAFAARGLRR